MISDKISKNIGILHRISTSAPKTILIKLYYALVYPYLTYCNAIWGAASENNLKKILLLQKRAVRVINNADFLDHSSPLFKQSNILKIDDIYKMTCCIIAFKNKCNYLKTNITHNTRNSNDLRVQFQRLVVTQRSLQFNVPNNYNLLPVALKEITSFRLFKRKLKEFFISAY